MAIFGFFNVRRLLNTLTPGAREAQLGDLVVGNANATNELQTQFNAVLAALDASGVDGFPTTFVANFATTEPPVTLPPDQ